MVFIIPQVFLSYLTPFKDLFLKLSYLSTLSLLFYSSFWLFGDDSIPENCNVLWIICDDLNDFEGVFGGHPQAQTPHMDALAASGVTFINAHSNAPICGPSRSSFLTGIYPHNSNNYAFENWYNPGKANWFENSILQNSKTIMHYMRDNGYQSYGTGKIMHFDLEDDYIYPSGHPMAGQLQTDWSEFGAKANYGPMVYDQSAGETVNHPKIPYTFYNGAGNLNSLFGSLADVPTVNGHTGWWKSGWLSAGAYNYKSDINRDDMQDESVRKWAVNKLNLLGADDKFFMMVGFHNPHTPLVAPQSYFDQYPLETLVLPPRIDNDIADTYFRNNAKPSTSTFKVYSSMVDSVGETSADGTTYASEEHFLKAYLQAYLACVSFVDDQIGALINALNASIHASDTIVILTSDHGYEFGEKEALSKNTLWENSTRVPLIIRVPGLNSSAGHQVDEPVSLIDLYPTVRDLCGLTTDTKKNSLGADLDGYSMRQLLTDPSAGVWSGPDVALSMVSTETSDDPQSKNFAVRSTDWRYIRYENGQEELYNLSNDPYEFTNLIASNNSTAITNKNYLSNALLEMVPHLATAGRNLLIDPSFEWLSASSVPDSTEGSIDRWVTTEPSANLYQISREGSVVHTGNFALKFQQRWTTSPVIQLLEQPLDVNKTYTLSFWLYSGDNDISLLGNNSATVDVELWSSPNIDGSFNHRVDIVTAIENSVANTWERFEGSIDASSLAAHDGDYLQLRIVRNDNVKNTIYLDDFVLNAYVQNSFEQWAYTNGLNPSGVTHDYDDDQYSNLEEFALGGDPKNKDLVPYRVSIASESGSVLFNYPRRKNTTTTYVLETTTDLNSPWSAANYAEQATNESFDGYYDKIINIIPTEDLNLSKFIRVQINSN